MFIKQLKLHNIRSYINETIDFPEGSLMLSGDIGSGKSSILLAIEFALFGIMRGSLDGAALLRNGKNTGFVELNFEIDGKGVVIKRTLKRDKQDVRQDSGYIIVDEVKQDCTPTELKSKILELLGYPEELITKSKSLIYRYTVYTPQEEMKAILFEAEEYRLDTLRRVFQIDKYQRARENASVVVREIKSKRNASQVLISDLEEKQKKKKEVEQELKKIKLKLTIITPKISENKKKIEAQHKNLEELEQKTNELNQLKKELSIAETKLSEKTNLINRNTEDIKVLEEEIKKLREGIEKIKVKFSKEDIEKKIEEKEKLYHETIGEQKLVAQRKRDLSKDISLKLVMLKDVSDKKGLMNSLKEEIKEKDKVKTNIKSLEEDLTKTLEAIKENLIVKENSERIKIEISKLEKCPLCLQPVTQAHKKDVHEKEEAKLKKALKLIEEKTKIRLDKEKGLEQQKRILEELLEKDKQLERVKTEIKQLENLEEELKSKSNEIEQLEKREEELKKINPDIIKAGLERIKELLKQVNERVNTIKIIDEKNSYKERLEKNQIILKKDVGDIDKEKLRLSNEIKNVGDVEKAFSETRQKLDELREKEKSLLIEKTSVDKEIESNNKELSRLEEEINTRLKIKQELQKLKDTQNWLEEYFINLLGLMEKHVLARVYNEFNELFQKWFNILMEDSAISVRLNEEFSPIIEQNGYEISLANLSGGEKTSCALAYRLALNKVINDMITGIKTKDIIILDEPTDGFSTEQLEKVRDVIKQINAKQIIVVSHEPKVESFVDSVMKVTKEEHVSKVTQ